VDWFFTSLLASPLLGPPVSFGLAVALLVLLGSLWFYGGVYYSLPRMVLKWFSGRALRAA
jgi:hypothetical protein